MIQYIALNIVIKLRWLLILVGIILMASYLYDEQQMSSKVMFTGILFNIILLIGIVVNIRKLTTTIILTFYKSQPNRLCF